MQREQIEQEALNLSDVDRAVLALHLLDSLDSVDTDYDEGLWIEEAERRWNNYMAGRIASLPLEEVMRDARSRL
ncbi:MAG TPA: addiction module protein [Candidatus Hydrogenedentes bacterium]|nr:MAG: putative addiction module component [Candidatus Hydrogenedentes bacterium ADurb.Bin179]HOH28637.1 addiction module protein [Candidatus Hydrogenedentota bacterium]